MTAPPASTSTAASTVVPVRPDWRESLTTAADLAVLGFVVIVGCVPVVTAGAALAAATTAVDQLCGMRSLPEPRELLRTAGRGMLGGLIAVLVAVAATVLVLLDLRLLTSGVIPGGPPMVAAVAAIGAGLAAICGTSLVRVGQTGGTGWRPAVAWSLRRLRDRPLTGPAVLAVLGLAVLLGSTIPVTIFFLPGFVLFGLHAVVRRLGAR